MKEKGVVTFSFFCWCVGVNIVSEGARPSPFDSGFLRAEYAGREDNSARRREERGRRLSDFLTRSQANREGEERTRGEGKRARGLRALVWTFLPRHHPFDRTIMMYVALGPFDAVRSSKVMSTAPQRDIKSDLVPVTPFGLCAHAVKALGCKKKIHFYSGTSTYIVPIF